MQRLCAFCCGNLIWWKWKDFKWNCNFISHGLSVYILLLCCISPQPLVSISYSFQALFKMLNIFFIYFQLSVMFLFIHPLVTWFILSDVVVVAVPQPSSSILFSVSRSSDSGIDFVHFSGRNLQKVAVRLALGTPTYCYSTFEWRWGRVHLGHVYWNVPGPLTKLVFHPDIHGTVPLAKIAHAVAFLTWSLGHCTHVPDWNGLKNLLKIR